MFDAMVKIGLNPKVLAFCSILLSKHNVIMSSLPHTHTHTHTQKMGLIMKQIAICLDKSMKVIQCPSQTMTSSCEQGSSIYYPTSRYSTH